MKIEDYTMIVNNSIEYFNIEQFYTDNENGSAKVRITKTGTLIEEIAGEEGSWFASYSTKSGSFFSVYKEYNHKGCIQKKWATFRNGGARIGILYEFDNEGKLSMTQNEEEDFTFTPYDVISYCIDHHIDLLANGYQFVERFKNPDRGEFLYFINYIGIYEGRYGSIKIILNGKNGQTEEVTVRENNNNDPEIILTNKK
jgi:hypothetical protein